MNIIVGYNGSEIAKKALELSKKHAKAFNGIVTIFVSKASDINEDSSDRKAERFWADVKEVEKELERLVEEFKKESIHCLTQLSARSVDTGTDILDYAKKIGADEIIIGIEKHSKVGKLLFGSTAQKVILESECPVLTVGN